MGKNVWIEARDLTDAEREIGDVRGWHTGADVVLAAAAAANEEERRYFEADGSFYGGPWLLSAGRMRELLPAALDVERTLRLQTGHLTAFVELFERLARERRQPVLFWCP